MSSSSSVDSTLPASTFIGNTNETKAAEYRIFQTPRIHRICFLDGKIKNPPTPGKRMSAPTYSKMDRIMTIAHIQLADNIVVYAATKYTRDVESVEESKANIPTKNNNRCKNDGSYVKARHTQGAIKRLFRRPVILRLDRANYTEEDIVTLIASCLHDDKGDKKTIDHSPANRNNHNKITWRNDDSTSSETNKLEGIVVPQTLHFVEADWTTCDIWTIRQGEIRS
ncbi:MAG: hypothetical protein Sylvanvirus38_3 [Sylvanvirus sp.]|uniref:Uncharacterized protein n=1 Tax=Sylvanvirus sp. TaxID=2487774 RepID=A0A3G5AJY5_9VIRU|nr:MAG: hypothetical protein Sylvanvirus38_3 [Sylvanvirus sp.]